MGKFAKGVAVLATAGTAFYGTTVLNERYNVELPLVDIGPIYHGNAKPSLAERADEAVIQLDEARANANEQLAAIAVGCVDVALEQVDSSITIDAEGNIRPIPVEGKAIAAANIHKWCVEGRPEGDGFSAIIGRGEALIDGGATYDESQYSPAAFTAILEQNN